MKIRHALVLAAAVVMPLAVVSPAGAAADPYQQCKDGGYVNFKDPLTGKPFPNQGRCVSSLARGGALVPVVAPVTVDFKDANGTGTRFEIFGPAGSYPVTVVVDGVVTQTFTAAIGSSGSSGLLDVPLSSEAGGYHVVTVTVEDQTFTETVQIYSSAVLTIGAATTPDPNFGIYLDITVTGAPPQKPATLVTFFTSVSGTYGSGGGGTITTDGTGSWSGPIQLIAYPCEELTHTIQLSDWYGARSVPVTYVSPQLLAPDDPACAS